jgi:hypothetical protein
MRTALRGRGTRHDDSRQDDSRYDEIAQQHLRGRSRRLEPHLTLRDQPHPFG